MGIGLYGWQTAMAYAPAQYGWQRNAGEQPVQAAEPALTAAAPQDNPTRTFGLSLIHI